ncbi:hypothetical protein [Streptomyces noursei]|uniref:hypothetical protein n=1 Tax=Streptomyces noursei TaxID=1971 RepID=UPI0005C905BC|nr:hypothetical protein [Streptomyces noursei]
MASKFGDYQLGNYNVLPKDSKLPPYTAADTIHLSRIPTVGDDETTTAMDLTVVSSDVDMPLSDASDWFEKNLPDYDRDHLYRNDSWMDWLTGTPEDARSHLGGLGVYGRGQLLHDIVVAGGSENPAAVVGKLMAVAPLVCAGTLIQGQVEQEHEESGTVTVTDTTSEKIEAGLSITAGIEYDGFGLSGSGSLGWSKETTHSTTVSRTIGNKDTFHVEKGEWGRVDVRACAGVYVGWLAAKNFSGYYDVYPFGGPVHAPDEVSTVAVHQMRAPAGQFSPAEIALLDERTRVTREIRSLAAKSSGSNGEVLSRFAELRATQRRLDKAIRALTL